MNHDSIIKLTNRVAYYSVIALLYWIIMFVVIQIFDLKIFRARLTELFGISIIGLLAALASALMLNVMSNLSKISTAVSLNRSPLPSDDVIVERRSSRKIRLLLVTLPVVVGLLFAGDYASAQKKKSMLLHTSESLIADNRAQLMVLADYQFNHAYINQAYQTVEVIRRIDPNFPNVLLLQTDQITDKTMVLAFGERSIDDNEAEPVKTDYIYAAGVDERDYMQRVFAGQDSEPLFQKDGGNYRLFYPVVINQRIMILVFSDYQHYGKIGS